VAVNRCDPDLAEGLEEAARDHRDVVFDYSASTDQCAVATLDATLDLLDALDLDATVTDLATTMGRLGDHSDPGIRRARALGSLANPQRTLDLFGDPVTTPTLDTTHPDSDSAGHSAEPRGSAESSAGAGVGAGDGSGLVRSSRRQMPWDGHREWNSQVGNLYLHLDAADLRALLTDGLTDGLADGLAEGLAEGTVDEGLDCCEGVAGAVDLERLGAASLRLVRDWLSRLTRINLRPVLDMTASDPVDQHDPPPAMRDQVVLRDGQCVFPGCGVHARACDQDHIIAYVPIDQGGPPGQTRPDNLACLCRRHHRMKTHHGWHYQPTRHGTYTWTDPTGGRYTTTPTPLHQHRAA